MCIRDSLDGLPFNDFDIELGEGYFIRCDTASDWTAQGTSLASGLLVSLQPGWNLVGVPYPSRVYVAQTLLDDINGQGGSCSEIDRWLNGGWDPHLDGLPFNDFLIEPDEGYFVRCTQASTFVPSTDLPDLLVESIETDPVAVSYTHLTLPTTPYV